ncbi:aminopeptidase P family protein [Rhabdaerophilum calidifontis]|uniref:aminopeptidase P family protein n=1 Tax=Rhabdaerophilum calidifontis TaxID=2604328 RepID=UPI001FE2A33C|nr:aminopeptidase P family protein [Rhabdaerophilum calidifontis]
MAGSRFQSFTAAGRPDLSRARLAALRGEMARAGLAGLLVPRADIFQGEYIPESENRLGWATGFTGSAGFLIVLAEKAALFVDGRYTAQASAELDPAVVHAIPLAETAPETWLRANTAADARIGYDPALFTPRGLKRFARAAEEGRFTLAPLAADPFAAIWPERPAAPKSPVVEHPLRFAGEDSAAKVARLQQALAAEGLTGLVVSECPSVNWLFNLRAGDVPHLPILRAFALVPAAGRPLLFADPVRLAPPLAARLATLADIVPPEAPPGDGRAELVARLAPLAAGGRRIRLDEESGAVLFARAIEAAGGIADPGADPLALMKAQKNATELDGARAAHLRDGIAMARFLAWLAREAPAGGITEIDAVIALEGFRAADPALVDIAFPTIAGAGANAALPHYRVSAATNRPLAPGLFLIDSGGQYRDGTTDITRTIVIGSAGRAMRAAFTRVLKGMIALSRAIFPKGTSGAQIDAFARQFLWAAGQDFDHGTGHGVGSFLSVHEGPQRISKLGTAPLLPGMILSNEPGYYREGHFGIRIENLVAVTPMAPAGAERAMLGFETLTHVPIDRAAIVKSMLTRAERAWLDAYHAETLARLAPHLAGADLAFLEKACQPL